MDIKLVKNFEEGNYIPVNDQLLLFLTTVTMSVPVRIILSIPPWQT